MNLSLTLESNLLCSISLINFDIFKYLSCAFCNSFATAFSFAFGLLSNALYIAFASLFVTSILYAGNSINVALSLSLKYSIINSNPLTHNEYSYLFRAIKSNITSSLYIILNEHDSNFGCRYLLNPTVFCPFNIFLILCNRIIVFDNDLFCEYHTKYSLFTTSKCLKCGSLRRPYFNNGVPCFIKSSTFIVTFFDLFFDVIMFKYFLLISFCFCNDK
mmetsp:Transcript_30453/g.37363  ORF Transcript_30453/g.37363 Transcript_30453/m.37363 type:complete len:217 (-) Transcript_30453:413-1063(-)